MADHTGVKVLSFKAFLVEAKRTRPQAQKILKRITPRLGRGYHDGDISTIIPHEYYPAFRTPDGRAIGDNYENQHTYADTKGKLKNVPVKSIVTSQSTINSGVLKKKIQGKWTEPHYPDIPTAIHHNGVHYLLDGNHRVAKARLLGQSHILMKVADARPFENEDYKKEYKKKFPDPVDEAFEKKTYVLWKEEIETAYHPDLDIQPNKPFQYIRNTKSAKKYTRHLQDDPFAQKLEPAGRYMQASSMVPSHLEPHMEVGTHTFTNPLYIKWGESGLYRNPDNWKHVLSNHYKGKKGKRLSQAIRDSGHDGIVTVGYHNGKPHTSEVVDLTMYRPQKINEKWSTERYESPRTGKKIFARNQTTIDGHHVDVHFSGTGDKDFSVNYMVNGSYWRSPKMDKKTGQKIIGHVHRSIMSFARHMRPASLNFSSSKDRNIDLHAKLSARLARRHKGSVETRQVTDLTHHTVKFPMTESVKDVEDEIKAQHGVDLNIYHDSKNNDIHLAHISVPKGKRKQGIGSAAMKHLTAYADKHGHRIRLDLADRDYSFGTTSKNRLRRFYGRFGFVSNKGRNKDFTIRSSMYRKPSTMTESVSDYIPIHRGESVHNKAGGPMGGKFYSTDKEWARQFTQTGRLSEVKTRYIHKDHVLDKSNVYAGDDIEPHLHEAKNNGYAAVRFHEGNGEPHSIYVINHSKLRFTQR